MPRGQAGPDRIGEHIIVKKIGHGIAGFAGDKSEVYCQRGLPPGKRWTKKVFQLTTRRFLLAATVAIGLALAGGIAGAADAANCTMAKVSDWPVRLVRNHLVVDGAINGRPVAVTLDTGSTASLIHRAAAERLDLVRRELKGARMYGVGGESRVEIAMVDEFKVGDTVHRNWSMRVSGERDIGADVFLGEDFFQLVDVEFDLAQGRVRLYQPRDCDGVSLAYWASAGVGEVEIEPISAARPHILLAVQINGQPLKAMLDSGSALSVLGKVDAARLGVTPETPGVVAAGKWVGIGSKAIESWVGPFQSFTIGNETIRDTQIRFADLFRDATYSAVGSHIPVKVEGLQTFSMLLGADFLRSHRVLVSHSQRKVYFTYNGGPVFQVARP